jgi:O-antigen/teichoic acid export membrane protein
MLFINLLAINMTTFFQFISQITSRFKEYSSRIIALSITNILIVLVLYIFNLNDYRIYTQLIVVTNFLLLLWYVYTYKDIVFGPHNSFLEEKSQIIEFFKYGSILLIANLSTTLVLTVNKQVVEIFFSVEEFGVYSFAYSMLSIITVIVSAVSVVLYPTFKKIAFDKLILQYADLNRIIILIVMIGLVGYFPLQWLIPNFLPEYIDSLEIFRIALPGLLFSSTISAIKHNYFKVANKNNHYFYISFFVILFNIAISLGVYYYYRSLVSIAISSIIGLVVWYIATEIYMVKKHSVKWKTNGILLAISIIMFYSLTTINNHFLSGALYTLLTGLLIILCYGKNIYSYTKKTKKD